MTQLIEFNTHSVINMDFLVTASTEVPPEDDPNGIFIIMFAMEGGLILRMPFETEEKMRAAWNRLLQMWPAFSLTKEVQPCLNSLPD